MYSYKGTLFCLSIIFFNFLSFAQPKITIKQGEPVKPEKNALFKRILGTDDDSFYILRVKTKGIGTKYFVERYDKNTFSLIYSTDLGLDNVPGAITDPLKTTVNSFATPTKVYMFF